MKDQRNIQTQMPDSSIVVKVWNYVHVLKNTEVDNWDYVEETTYLLLLKLAGGITELSLNNPIPAEFQWTELSSKSGPDLETHYRLTLENPDNALNKITT